MRKTTIASSTGCVPDEQLATSKIFWRHEVLEEREAMPQILRLLGLAALMGLVFIVTYVIMSASNNFPSANVLGVAAHLLAVLFSVLGASWSAFLAFHALKNGEISIAKTVSVSREKWEYWFWVGFLSVCSMAFLGMLTTSLRKLASWPS